MGDQSPNLPGNGALDRICPVSIAVGDTTHAPMGAVAYTLRKLLRLALDIVLSSSDKPLRLVAALGIVVSMVAVGVTELQSDSLLARGYHGSGHTSLIASMWLLAGVMLFCMGIIGLLLAASLKVSSSGRFLSYASVGTCDLLCGEISHLCGARKPTIRSAYFSWDTSRCRSAIPARCAAQNKGRRRNSPHPCPRPQGPYRTRIRRRSGDRC